MLGGPVSCMSQEGMEVALFLGGNVTSTQGSRRVYETSAYKGKKKETMAKPVKAPWFARWGIVLTIPLLRAGIKLAGPGNYPMYLLTVRGRKSGQLRTVPILLLEQNEKCYLAAAYGSVNWVHNLRAA